MEIIWGWGPGYWKEFRYGGSDENPFMLISIRKPLLNNMAMSAPGGLEDQDPNYINRFAGSASYTAGGTIYNPFGRPYKLVTTIKIVGAAAQPAPNNFGMAIDTDLFHESIVIEGPEQPGQTAQPFNRFIGPIFPPELFNWTLPPSADTNLVVVMAVRLETVEII